MAVTICLQDPSGQVSGDLGLTTDKILNLDSECILCYEDADLGDTFYTRMIQEERGSPTVVRVCSFKNTEYAVC